MCSHSGSEEGTFLLLELYSDKNMFYCVQHLPLIQPTQVSGHQLQIAFNNF